MKRLVNGKVPRLGVTFAFVAAVTIAPLSGIFGQNVYAATKTWTGAGSDNKFSTAANWSGNSVPVDGDVLAITTPPSSAEVILIDDIATKFSSVQISGSATGNPWPTYILQGELNLQSGATFNNTADGYVFRADLDSGTVKGDGSLTVLGGSLPNNLTVNGTVTYKSGTSAQLTVPGATRVVIENGAYSPCNLFGTYATPLTLGGGSGAAPTIDFGSCRGSGGVDEIETATLSDVTLASDAIIGVWGNDRVVVTNLTKNGYTLTRDAEADGTLELPDGVQQTEYEPKTTELSGDSTSNATLVPKETGVLSGKRGHVHVRSEAVLKGVGTVEGLSVSGTVAPGNSPGTITVVQSFDLNTDGTYEAELLNASSYDQIKAGSVSLLGTLHVSLVSGWSIKQGDTFTIVDNTGTLPVGGTFAALPEGAELTVNGLTFKISYVGGDGNDVVLTALNGATDPSAPNTGLARLMKANPVVVIAMGLIAVITIGTLAVRGARRK